MTDIIQPEERKFILEKDELPMIPPPKDLEITIIQDIVPPAIPVKKEMISNE